MSPVTQGSGRGRPLSPPASERLTTGLREAATRGKGVQQVNDGNSARPQTSLNSRRVIRGLFANYAPVRERCPDFFSLVADACDGALECPRCPKDRHAVSHEGFKPLVFFFSPNAFLSARSRTHGDDPLLEAGARHSQ